MTAAQHEAWEQILSVAKNAALVDVDVLAARYLAGGGYPHIVARLGIAAAEPVEVAAPAPNVPAVVVEPIEPAAEQPVHEN